MNNKIFNSSLYEKNLFVNFYITLTRSNTFITITDSRNCVINSVSTGVVGFKSSKKKSTFAAQAVLDKIISNTKIKAGRNLIMAIYIRGENTNRDLLLKSLNKHNVILNCIVDITGIAHNGCRAPKKRRI
jgi:small subunit ribosomal protein S11